MFVLINKSTLHSIRKLFFCQIISLSAQKVQKFDQKPLPTLRLLSYKQSLVDLFLSQLWFLRCYQQSYQDRLESSQSKIIVALSRKLFLTKFEERDDLFRQLFSWPEALREEHHFANESLVGFGHGQASEQLLQVVRQIRTAGIARIHCDKDCHISIDSHLEKENKAWKFTSISTFVKAKIVLIDNTCFWLTVTINYINFRQIFRK